MNPTVSQRILLALLSGVLVGLSVNEWHRISFAFMAWPSFLPLFISLKGRIRFSGYYGLAYLYASIYLMFALGTFLINSPVAGFLVILFGAVLFSAPLALVFPIKQRFGEVRAFFALAFLWPAFDYWIVEKLLEMPIYTLSICQASYPWLIQYIDITGYIGISTWVISLNTVLYIIYTQLKSGSPFSITKTLRWMGVVALHFVLPLLYLVAVKAQYTPKLTQSVSVLSIQEEFPDPNTATDSTWVDIVKSYVTITDSVMADKNPDLILWPESAIPVQFKEQSQLQEALLSYILNWETPLLSGSFDIRYAKYDSDKTPLMRYLNRDNEVYNAALLLTPQFAWNVLAGNISAQQLNVYQKEHAMPFTEKVPLSEEFPVLSNLAIQVGNLIHISEGKNDGLLRFLTKDERVVSVHPLICWDLLFSHPEDIRKSNPRFIAGLANETHFGKVLSTMPNGLVGYSIMRSIEYRRALVKSSSQGFTFTINPFGEITHSIPWLQNDTLLSTAELSSITTFYMKHPRFYAVISVGIFALLSFYPTNKQNRG